MTEYNPISFPGLGITVDPTPVAFTIIGQPIFYYGIIIGSGFLLAVLYLLRQCKKNGINENDILDFLLVVTPLSIIGARLYYVLWNLSQYETFWDVINIRKGGLAIYGAIITSIVVAVLYFKWKKMKLLPFMDIGVIGLLIGQCIGRWGNFINREAYGSLCDLPWRMEIYSSFYQARVAVHPTFLYESLWNLIGIFLLHFYSKKKKFHGEIFLLYIGWYGLGRSMIEGLRTDSLYLFSTGIRISQLVGILSFVLIVCLLGYLYKGKNYQKFVKIEDEHVDTVVLAQGELPREQQDALAEQEIQIKNQQAVKEDNRDE